MNRAVAVWIEIAKCTEKEKKGTSERTEDENTHPKTKNHYQPRRYVLKNDRWRLGTQLDANTCTLVPRCSHTCTYNVHHTQPQWQHKLPPPPPPLSEWFAVVYKGENVVHKHGQRKCLCSVGCGDSLLCYTLLLLAQSFPQSLSRSRSPIGMLLHSTSWTHFERSAAALLLMPVAQRQDGLVLSILIHFLEQQQQYRTKSTASDSCVECVSCARSAYNVHEYGRYIVPFTHEHLPHTILFSRSSSA